MFLLDGIAGLILALLYFALLFRVGLALVESVYQLSGFLLGALCRVLKTVRSLFVR